jgi:1,5-anhydro-D-fructose reductase (1,5-anhydro-D-mannitol-forming)
MTIGFGLIGASSIARDTMIPAMRNHPECKIATVFSSNPARGESYAAENKIPRAANSVDELLADPEVQAVYISTTNELHHQQVLAAARAGKHILCEKPLAMKLDETGEMIATCHKVGVILATNHHLRMGAGIRKMRDLITEGAIGKPLAARVFHAVYLPEYLQGWRLSKPGAGAGVVLDIVVHDIDTLRFVLDSEPTEVTSLSQHAGLATHDAVEDGNMAVFRFDNDLIAQVHTAFTVKYAGDGIEVHGSEGSLKLDNVLGRELSGPIILRNSEGEQQIELEQYSLDDKTIHLFIDAIQGQGEPGATGEDGERSLAAALACLESAQTGRKVEF